MKNIQDLTEHRQEIIDTITEEVGAQHVKEVMSILAKYVGFNGYFGMSAEAFTKAVIKDSGIADKIIMREGARARVRLEEVNIDSTKKLLKYI